MEKSNLVLGLIVFTLIGSSAQGARVGIVFSFPDGTTTMECVEVVDMSDGYETTSKARLPITWSDGGAWGHGLCGINDVGCPEDDCYCGGSEYWSFHASDGSNWKYMPVGWDAGEDCWDGVFEYGSQHNNQHYCARRGDVLGYAWGPWGTKPTHISYEEICPPIKKRNKEKGITIEGLRSSEKDTENKKAVAGEQITFTVKSSATGQPIKNSQAEVRDTNLKKLFTQNADELGTIKLTIVEPGEYRLLITAPNYPHQQIKINIEEAAKTTTSTTSTSTLDKTTTTSSTTTKLEHFLAQKTKTTTKHPTTTSKQAQTTKPTTTINKITGAAIQKQKNNESAKTAVTIIGLLVIGILLAARRK